MSTISIITATYNAASTVADCLSHPAGHIIIYSASDGKLCRMR